MAEMTEPEGHDTDVVPPSPTATLVPLPVPHTDTPAHGATTAGLGVTGGGAVEVEGHVSVAVEPTPASGGTVYVFTPGTPAHV